MHLVVFQKAVVGPVALWPEHFLSTAAFSLVEDTIDCTCGSLENAFSVSFELTEFAFVTVPIGISLLPFNDLAV